MHTHATAHVQVLKVLADSPGMPVSFALLCKVMLQLLVPANTHNQQCLLTPTLCPDRASRAQEATSA